MESSTTEPTVTTLTPQQLELIDRLATIQADMECCVREKRAISEELRRETKRRVLKLTSSFPFITLQ